MTVAILFHRFGPYHSARLEAAAHHCSIAAIELAAQTDEYEWSKVEIANGCNRVTLFPEGDSRSASPAELQKKMTDALTECQPDAVAIPGWSDKGAFAALRWCAQNGTPAILMSESTAHDEPRVWWKEFVKRRIVGLYSTALVGGRLHAAYLRQLGMAGDRIFTGYDVVDNAHFSQPRSPLRLERGEGRGEVSSPQYSPCFLASARFIPKKNLFTLLRAYADYRTAAGANAWKLVLLGDGPLRSALNSELSTLNLADSVLMPGFKQYDELPEFYAQANAFVHASTSEQWGLVVNEAIAAGLPVIVSNRCGCAPELVQERVNGFTFDPHDAHELSARMIEMASMEPGARARMGAASREIANRHLPARFGEGLKQAAQLALSSPPRTARAFDSFLLERLLRR